MLGVAALAGIAIGFALGLTGGGGGIFAVPLLVFGLGLEPRDAVGVSLAAVGATALTGAVAPVRRGEVDLRVGAMFAVAGMLGAPIGSWLGGLIPPWVLLVSFSGLMVLIAGRMWMNAGQKENATRDVGGCAADGDDRKIGCSTDEHGKTQLGLPCLAVLAGLGLGTGILSGLFGVGGGFVIVPALVLFTGMRIHTAVPTSLLVIFLISISGVASFVLSGGELPWRLTALFIVGGIVGVQLGSRLSRKISGPALQKTFAAAVLAVACFVAVRSLLFA